MKLLILGWVGHHNIGDESYKKTFKILFPQHNLTFVNTLKKEDVNECDAIVLGGGNVIRKDFINQLAEYRHKNIFGFSVGVEEYPVQDISFFKHVYARDEATLKILKDKGVSCSFVPDAAFILSGDENAGKNWLENSFQLEKHNLYSNVITVVINGYILNGGLGSLARDAFNFINFSYNLARIIDETPASFVFIPFGTQIPHDDRVANAWVASKCKYSGKNHVAFDRLSIETILNVISASNLVISSRLHSSIFSFTCGVPFIDIIHHSKNDLFINMIGKKENSVSFWNLDSSLLKTKIHEMMHFPKNTENIKYRELIWETVNAIHFD